MMSLAKPSVVQKFSQEKLSLLRKFSHLIPQRAGVFLRAKVKPICSTRSIGSKVQSETTCDLDALYGQVIDRLSFEAELGPKAEVNGLIIHGQLLTKEDVIRREVLLERGQALSADALLLSQSNLRGLGLFRSVWSSRSVLALRLRASLIEPVTLTLNVETPWLLDGYFGLRLTDEAVTTDLQGLNLLYTSALTLRVIEMFSVGRGSSEVV